MKYALLVLVMATALIGGLIFSSGAVYAGDEIRLRAFLSDLVDDPLRLNEADFRQRPDRTQFSTEVHNVNLDQLGPGRVIVTRSSDTIPPTVILLDAPITIVLDPMRGTGVGHLDLDSRFGDDIPAMEKGDTVEVWIPDRPQGVLIATGTLHRKK